MIVSASYRTDIPAFHGRWFLTRLEAGFARVESPYGGASYEVSLRPGDVTAFVFWTRHIQPLMPALPEVAERAPFMVQFTLTGYPRAIEPGVIEAEAALSQVRELHRRWGARAVVWRYDPILISSLTPAQWHQENFARLAAALRGVTDEVVISWADLYRKTARNLTHAATRHGFSWRDPEIEEERALLVKLAGIAHEADMTTTLCTEPTLLRPGLSAARCIDAGRLSDIAGRPIAARERGNRPGCLCAESRDIGAYDTCAQGCAYCYAVSSRTRARARLKAIDEGAEGL
jgi:DNA repair photolyase